MNCGRDKTLKLLDKLNAAKGVGLIERVKQGQGKPTIIYVKQFTAPEVPTPAPDEDDATDVQTSEKPRSKL